MRAWHGVAFALLATFATDQQQPLFRSGVDLVTIDVHVVDADGNPAGDLRPDEFVVKVDGQPRRTSAAELMAYRVPAVGDPSRGAVGGRPAGAPAAAAGVPRHAPTPRTILLVVDEGNIRAGSARPAADAARQFVASLEPADRVGLVSIPETSTRIEATTDHAAVSRALDRIVGHRTSVETQIGMQQALGLTEAFSLQDNPRKWGAIVWRECVEKVTPMPQSPSADCVAELEHASRTMMADARQRMRDSARSLTAVVEAIAQVPGPKTLVLVSEELPVADTPSERADFRAETSRISAAAAKAQASVYVLQLHVPLFDVENRVAPADATADADARSFGLEAVATLTGGRRLMVSGRTEAAFQRIARETSAYYLVAVEAGPNDRDGKPHTVTVAVSRRGLQVRARREFRFADAAPAAAVAANPGTAGANPEAGSRMTEAAKAAEAPTAVPGAQPAAPAAGTESTVVALPTPRDLKDVLARAGRYVVQYGEEMSIVIAVERYSQWLLSSDFIRPITRQLVSEFALVRVNDDWLGFRDVYEVDGKAVQDRQDRLRGVLLDRSKAGLDRGRQIADESARHNLGAIQRNFNVPTTALFFLHPKNQARFSYKKDGEDALDGTRVWKIRYQEIRKPTIIRTSAGRDMPLTGTFWVEPVSGRVLKTHMELRAETGISADTRKPVMGEGVEDGAYSWIRTTEPRAMPKDALAEHRVDSSASITVTYKPDARLQLLLPVEMRETYEGAWARRTTNQEALTKVNCVATYGDFKRFETGGRVVPPK